MGQGHIIFREGLELFKTTEIKVSLRFTTFSSRYTWKPMVALPTPPTIARLKVGLTCRHPTWWCLVELWTKELAGLLSLCLRLFSWCRLIWACCGPVVALPGLLLYCLALFWQQAQTVSSVTLLSTFSPTSTQPVPFLPFWMHFVLHKADRTNNGNVSKPSIPIDI